MDDRGSPAAVRPAVSAPVLPPPYAELTPTGRQQRLAAGHQVPVEFVRLPRMSSAGHPCFPRIHLGPFAIGGRHVRRAARVRLQRFIPGVRRGTRVLPGALMTIVLVIVVAVLWMVIASVVLSAALSTIRHDPWRH